MAEIWKCVNVCLLLLVTLFIGALAGVHMSELRYLIYALLEEELKILLQFWYMLFELVRFA